ncbi:hypothetical protein VP01_1217g3 [Puccinia sorghi]|uniref:Uncharacterized protein n=1 Tax=Puccinia sorghi TaxID=27349 RepID=A0A0L6VQ83_9BASI|nr:hypothetical protein VP01_1217g3 [Puccinia sorghi]
MWYQHPSNKFKIAKLFDMHDDEFKQMMKMTKDGLMYLFSEVCFHPTFISTGPRPQLPVALGLERFGTFGNGGLVRKLAHNLQVGLSQSPITNTPLLLLFAHCNPERDCECSAFW